jgi:hypothetical protein
MAEDLVYPTRLAEYGRRFSLPDFLIRLAEYTNCYIHSIFTIFKNDDPFEVPDDHPAAVLRLTSTAFAAYVLTLQDSVEQGRRLERIWSQFLIVGGTRRPLLSVLRGSTKYHS